MIIFLAGWMTGWAMCGFLAYFLWPVSDVMLTHRKVISKHCEAFRNLSGEPKPDTPSVPGEGE